MLGLLNTIIGFSGSLSARGINDCINRGSTDVEAREGLNNIFSTLDSDEEKVVIYYHNDNFYKFVPIQFMDQDKMPTSIKTKYKLNGNDHFTIIGENKNFFTEESINLLLSKEYKPEIISINELKAVGYINAVKEKCTHLCYPMIFVNNVYVGGYAELYELLE